MTLRVKREVVPPEKLDLRPRGKAGEWIARNYYMKHGYLVWMLEEPHFGYSGTGYKYANIGDVLTSEECSLLRGGKRKKPLFDLLIVPKEEWDSLKKSLRVFPKAHHIFTHEERVNELKERIEILKGIRKFLESSNAPQHYSEYINKLLSDAQETLKRHQMYYQILAKREYGKREELSKLTRILINVRSCWRSIDKNEIKYFAEKWVKEHQSEISQALNFGFKIRVLFVDFSNISSHGIIFTEMELASPENTLDKFLKIE